MDTKELDELKKALQKRVGAKPDGDIGERTIGKINLRLDELDRLDRGAGIIVSDPAPVVARTGNLTISKMGLDQIIYFEIGDESYYNRILQAPTYPGWGSGVTVGIGYDCGYNTDAQIQRDWSGVIAGWMVDLLCTVNQYRGESARGPARSLKDHGVRVTLSQAREVYLESTLPRFAKLTAEAYPGLNNLTADAQSAILSLCFNRGTGMDSTDKRSEMRALRPAVLAGDLKKMSQLLLQMQRHWSRTSGLYTRRAREAAMVLNSDHPYAPEDLISV